MEKSLLELANRSVTEWERYASSARQANMDIETFLRSIVLANRSDNNIPVTIGTNQYENVIPIHSENEPGDVRLISRQELSDLLSLASLNPGSQSTDTTMITESYDNLLESSNEYYRALSVLLNRDTYKKNLPNLFCAPDAQHICALCGGAVAGGIAGGRACYLVALTSPWRTDYEYYVVMGAIVGIAAGMTASLMTSITVDNLKSKWKARRRMGGLEAAMDVIGNSAMSSEERFHSALSDFCQLTEDLPSPDGVEIVDTSAADKVPGLYEKLRDTAICAHELLDRPFVFKLPEYEHVDLTLLDANQELARYLEKEN